MGVYVGIVGGLVPGGTPGAGGTGWIFKGLWNATTNTPALSSGVGEIGDAYKVSATGSTNLDGITDWQVGDYAVFDGALSAWVKIDNTDAVLSVNGMTGIVTIPAASEVASGIAELATQVETDAGADDARIVTPLKRSLAAIAGDLSGQVKAPIVEKATGAVKFSVETAFSLVNEVTEPTFTTTNGNDDIGPAGIERATVLYLSSTGASRRITGIVAPNPAFPQVLLVVSTNSSGGPNIRMRNNDAASLAANRFLLDSTTSIKPESGNLIRYDVAVSRWRLVGSV